MLLYRSTYRVHKSLATAIFFLSTLYVCYMLLVGFLSLGKYDFNGDFNTLAENIFGGAVVLASVIQFGLAIALVKSGRVQHLSSISAVALVGLLIYVFWQGAGALLWAIPTNINALLMMLLYVPQYIAAKRIG